MHTFNTLRKFNKLVPSDFVTDDETFLGPGLNPQQCHNEFGNIKRVGECYRCIP